MFITDRLATCGWLSLSTASLWIFISYFAYLSSMRNCLFSWYRNFLSIYYWFFILNIIISGLLACQSHWLYNCPNIIKIIVKFILIFLGLSSTRTQAIVSRTRLQILLQCDVHILYGLLHCSYIICHIVISWKCVHGKLYCLAKIVMLLCSLSSMKILKRNLCIFYAMKWNLWQTVIWISHHEVWKLTFWKYVQVAQFELLRVYHNNRISIEVQCIQLDNF